MEPEQAPRWERWLAALSGAYLATTAVVALWSGFGADRDTYLLLRAWQVAAATGTYEASRFQGSLPTELGFGFLANLGGPVASNALSLVCAVGVLVFVGRTVGASTTSTWAALALAANPEFWIGSTTTMDYLPALAVYALGMASFSRSQPVWGVLGLAVAAATRLSYAPLAVLSVWACVEAPRRDKLRWLVAVVATIGMLYVPVWMSAGFTLDFLGASRPTAQGLFGLIARFVYDVWMTVGVIPLLALLAGAWIDRARWMTAVRSARHPTPTVRLGALLLAYHLAVFAYIPVDGGYLIPAVVGAVLVTGGLGCRTTLIAWTMGSLVSGVVAVDPVVVKRGPSRFGCTQGNALGASVSPHLVVGPLWNSMLHRRDQESCLLAAELLEPPREVGGRLPWPDRVGAASP